MNDRFVDIDQVIIIYSISKKQRFGAFAFPLAWIPLLQFAGTLVDGPSNSLGLLFAYNVDVLSKGSLVVKEYPFKTEESIAASGNSASRQLGSAWHQLQITDAYWALHASEFFPRWSDGLSTPHCPCGNNKASCPDGLEDYIDTEALFLELQRTCKLAAGTLLLFEVVGGGGGGEKRKIVCVFILINLPFFSDEK
mgnify:CR=1 FL=1